MFRAVLPYLIEVVLVLFDTSVIPVFTTFRYIMPVSLAFAMAYAMYSGAGRGVIAGLLGGYLSDVIGGSPFGYMMAFYAFSAFLMGFIGYSEALETRMSTAMFLGVLLRRVLGALAVLMLMQSLIIAVQYFSNAYFDKAYFLIAFRKAMMGTLEMFIVYCFMRLIDRKKTRRVEISAEKKEREL